MSEGWDGDCFCMTTADGLEVVTADPKVEMTGELVAALRNGYGAPGVRLVGDVLTIRAVNRTVVYVIGEYQPLTDTYRAEWPD